MGNNREPAGWVVVYTTKPVYKGLHAFLVRGPDGWRNNGFSLGTAHRFPSESEAAAALAASPGPPDDAHHRGQVRQVYRETHLVLGGESFDDINDLLGKIRDTAPYAGGVPAAAVGGGNSSHP